MCPTEPPRRHLGAYALCTTGGGRILLVRASVGSDRGRWTLPGGGVEPFEHPETAVARELYEETGITATSVGPVLGVYSRIHPAATTRFGRAFHHIGILYRVEIPQDSEPRPERDGSTDECGWFTYQGVSELPLAALAEWAVPLASHKAQVTDR